jgi:NMD protein affecting ribosome stability and mRNA decay
MTGRRRRAAPVQVTQLPTTRVRVEGAVCPTCERLLEPGESATIVSGVLVHSRVSCLPKP